VKAKKSFGQHFLADMTLADKIIENFILNNTTQNALEVGPGKGVLTKKLLETYPNLTAVEADHDMVHYLNNQLKIKNLIQGDFLQQDLNEIMKGASFGIVGNFPYNISSQIVFKMLDYIDQIPVMVGMFQKEMAERIVAKPGKKTFGVISVLVQAYYEGEILFTLKPSAFEPPPKVDSAVIILRRKKNQNLDYDHIMFKDIIKTTFQQRRKMIRNTLKKFLLDDQMNDSFFDRRPETLSLEEFINLTKIISQNESRS
jgi:16S rRNA (adenine1518-N6/adenine1519-N6)-dimethyltransferase